MLKAQALARVMTRVGRSKSQGVVFGRLVILVSRTAPKTRISVSRSGKMPTTSVRRRISRLARSLGLLDQIRRQISLGSW